MASTILIRLDCDIALKGMLVDQLCARLAIVRAGELASLQLPVMSNIIATFGDKARKTTTSRKSRMFLQVDVVHRAEIKGNYFFSAAYRLVFIFIFFRTCIKCGFVIFF